MGKFWNIIDSGLTGSYILQSYNIAIRITIKNIAKHIANCIVYFTIRAIAILLATANACM